MKIYGFDVSNPTNKVRYVANALGLNYDFEFVVPFTEMVQNDTYRELHPVEKVPAIEEDDGYKMFESSAIIRYLAAKENSDLYPKDLRERAKVDQWMNFAEIHIRGGVARVFWNRVGVKYMGVDPDESSLKTGLEFLARFLPVVDRQLGKVKYIAGDQMTLADFSLLAELDGAELFELDLSPYKNLSAWRQNLQSQDFYQIDRSKGMAMIEERIAQNT